MLHFALLGPMEIRVDGEVRTPSPPMARRVLAVLLTHADRVVPTELLIDELWGEHPPKRARKTVQTYICHLRKALGGDGSSGPGGGDPVETHPYGYRLRLQGCRSDLWLFQERVRAGREALARGEASEGVATLRRGLELWRGAALEGVETGTVLGAQATRLEELRMRALEQRVAGELALGRHHSLLEEIRDLASQHPLNEEFCAQLMTAASACGQRGEALGAYARMRRAMAEQLGLEPSERLRELQRDILTGQGESPSARTAARGPGRSGEPGAPFHLPAAIGDFVGRQDELERIERAVSGEGRAPEVRVVTVTGGPGVGKTEAALQVAHRLRGRFPDGQLRGLLCRKDRTPRDPGEVLGELLAAVGYDRAVLPERVDDLARMFRGWAAGRRFLLVLDDAVSRDQVVPLLPAGTDNTVIVTSRCRLSGLPGSVTDVELGPLPGAVSRQLLTQVIGPSRARREPAAVSAIVAKCEGMPAAVRAVGGRIATWPHRSLADFAVRLEDDGQRLEELSSPHLDMRRYLVESADRLPRSARDVLAELGRAATAEVTVADLALGLCRSTSSIERSVELLAAFHVVRPVVRDGGYVLRLAPLIRLAFAGGGHTAPAPELAAR
ncbi:MULTISPECIES: AfsR/SARP family transcriptional regulator [Streptomyces]|uniref:AfsR/SARP family transcriptional regulator n=1 Tax=Streptomyces TaxID=1883 RepID=UPI001E606EEC|nr:MULTISPECIES: AfsR/SARP family transcriptional regulator [Streptomyces]